MQVLADEQGIRAALDEGAFHSLDLAKEFERLPGFFDKALWTFLEHPRVTEVAARFREAEALPESSWYRQWESVPSVVPRDEDSACQELSEAVASYFRLKEGRGRECRVDVYRRRESFFYFALPEDFAQADLEYDEDGLQRRSRRPVFQVVFVYDPSRPALDTFVRGPKKTRLDLEEIFCRVILGRDVEQVQDDRVYELNKFKRRGTKFSCDPASGITDVRVKFLRMSLLGGGKRRLTLEADPSGGRNAIYDLTDEVFGHERNGAKGGLSRALANVTRVGIEAEFTRGARRGKPTKTFYLTYPNACSLGYDGRDAVLRQMLIDSKIEPAKPAAAVAKR